MTNQAPRIPVYSILFISMTALAYEILLMRLFSIIQWHHFAYMIISLALLGYGASGTFLTLYRQRLLDRYHKTFMVNVLLFGVSLIVCFMIAQQVAFNPEEILWDQMQLLRLIVIYLLLALPFFFAANCIALTLMAFQSEIARVYASDLFGAGLGGPVIIGLLFLVFPDTALRILASVGIAITGLAWWELKAAGRQKPLPVFKILLSGLVVIPLLLPSDWVKPVLSPYKSLSQTLRLTGAHVVDERSSPLGQISVVESPIVPLRHAPGLSLNVTVEPPPQVGVFTDGDGMTAITRYEGNVQTLGYLDYMTSALPYHLANPAEVLILGAGGGADVLQAKVHGVDKIHAVELNEQIIELMQNKYSHYSSNLYSHDNVQVHIAEGRGFVASSEQHYDLIQIALLDSFAASSSGLYALHESYLYTVEALQAYLNHLKPDGYLSITRWIKMPPRDTLKLFATAVESLRRNGVHNPALQLILIRGWQTSTLLVKNGLVNKEEIQALQRFCDERSFDVAYFPEMPASMANHNNIMKSPYYYLGAKALLGPGKDAYLEQYKFNIKPATDDKPYFFNFFKWDVLPEIINLRGQGGMPLLELGYLILIATLMQALLASILLILVPLWVTRRKDKEHVDVKMHIRAFCYFLSLGLAFLFIEIAFIQKFILFLYHPLYSVAVVLSTFLIFAGLGSARSRRYMENKRQKTGIQYAVAGIIILGVFYLSFLEPIFTNLLMLRTELKILVSIILIAPLAYCMGMPFPLGLSMFGEKAPSLVPWVWGVNGCASVLSAVLATLLAINFGFVAVIILALILYGIATSMLA